MATQKQEEENFIRMFRLVTGVGIESLRVEFDRHFPPATLVSTLKSNEPKLKKLNKDKRINTKQLDLLFPSSGSPTSQDFDVTLMICLIRNLTGIRAPTNGFDKLPLPSELTPGADMARLKHYRNMLAHADSNAITAIDFTVWWIDLSDAIVRLGGGGNFKNTHTKKPYAISTIYLNWASIEKLVEILPCKLVELNLKCSTSSST